MVLPFFFSPRRSKLTRLDFTVQLFIFEVCGFGLQMTLVSKDAKVSM